MNLDYHRKMSEILIHWNRVDRHPIICQSYRSSVTLLEFYLLISSLFILLFVDGLNS